MNTKIRGEKGVTELPDMIIGQEYYVFCLNIPGAVSLTKAFLLKSDREIYLNKVLADYKDVCSNKDMSSRFLCKARIKRER